MAYSVGQSAGSLRFVAEERGSKIPERLLGKLWKEKAARQTGLRTEAGKRVRVVYPGRSGAAAGPDFRDALLEVEGVGLVRGDVELHIRQKDWDSHGHGSDPNYNGVVLHGALEVDSEQTRLHSGVQAPLVDLSVLLEKESDDELAPNRGQLDLWDILARKGFARPGSLDEAAETLGRAGDARFLIKSNWLVECIRDQGPEQALYQALMEGLGYSSNRRQFIELACRAPYQTIVKAAGELPQEDRFDAICGWLGSCSGLVEPDLPRPKGIGPAMNTGEWRLFRVRPANHPRRRVMGAALILDRFLERGLALGLAEVVGGSNPAKLIKALCAVSTDGSVLIGPGRALIGLGRALIGPGRAKDLAVNAVLPFMYGWGEISGQGSGPALGLSDAALAVFQRFPLLTDNELTREMKEQLLPAEWRGVVTNARRQQGLLHLSALLKGAY